MLYTVKPGDTLSLIARRTGTTVEAIMDANVICSPERIFSGEVLIIPEPGLDLPKAGGSPFYVVLPGDSLFCLARQFNSTVSQLARNNQISNPDRIQAYSELLVLPVNPNANTLRNTWNNTPGEDCLIFEPQRYGIYYLGTFEWYALGLRAIDPLLQLIEHRCAEVRFYTILSLGRIARDVSGRVKRALRAHFTDPDSSVAALARLAYRRVRLAEQGYRRTHLLIGDDELRDDINDPTPTITPLQAGTEVVVLRWFIPSPLGEEGPRGGVQIYDQVRTVITGRTGFIARRGNDEINFI